VTVYEYSCRFCKNHWEQKERIEETEIKNKKCPKCGKRKVSRVYSIVGIHFKGKGFSKSSH